MVTGQSRMSTWLLIAAVAIAAVALAVALTGRVGKSGRAIPQRQPEATAPGASKPPAPGPPPAPAPAGMIKVVTSPEGARVLVGGREVGLTPADVAIDEIRDRAACASR